MVVGDLHVAGVLPFPSEDDAPLFVDTDGMESGELAFHKLQAVAGGLPKVFEIYRFMDGNELVICTLLDCRGDFARKRQVENFLTLFVSEADNHDQKILKSAYPASENFLYLRIHTKFRGTQKLG